MREYILISVTCILTQITAESFMAFGNEKQRIKVPCGPHSDELIGSEEAIGGKNATSETVSLGASSSSSMASSESDSQRFSPRIRMSGTTIRPKEAILVILALALLVFSIMLFYKHWSKNYRELNTLPYYAYLYKENPESPPPTLAGSCMIPVGSTSDLGDPLSRTPSSRLLSRSRHGSFRTCSMDPMESQGSIRGGPGPLRLKSFKRNRPSFIHVTAEAMQRQKSLRIHANPWEYPSRKNRRRTVPTRLPNNERSSLETIFTEENSTKKQETINEVIHEIHEMKTFSSEDVIEESQSGSYSSPNEIKEESDVFIENTTTVI